MKIRQYACPALLAGALLLLPSAVMAQNFESADLDVSITINPVCLVTGANLVFTSQDVGFNTAVDGSADVIVNCSLDAPYQVGANLGIDPDGNQRRMSEGGNFVNYINYQLYTDGTWNTILGTNWQTDTIGGIGTGLDQPVTIYGRVPGQPLALAGNYTDIVMVTVQF